MSVESDASIKALEEALEDEEELVEVEVGVSKDESAGFEEEEEADDVAPDEQEGEKGEGEGALAASAFIFFDALAVSFLNAIISFNAAGIALAAFAPFTALAAFTGTTTTGTG